MYIQLLLKRYGLNRIKQKNIKGECKMTKEKNVLTQIEKELEQVKAKNDKEIADLQQALETAKAEADKAQQKVIDAKQGSSPTAFSKAVADHQTASNIVEYYAGKIEELQSEPLVTEEEYKDFTDRIKAEIDKLNDETGKAVKEALEVLAKAQPVLTDNLNKGNDMLKHLQHDLYKDDASMTVANGSRVRLPNLENRHKEYGLSQNIDYILNFAKERNLLN